MNTRKQKKLAKRLVEAAGFAPTKTLAALMRVGADPNRRDGDGTTPLYRASVQDMSDNVRILLAAGALPNIESGPGGVEGLPLCAAAAWGHNEVVRHLLAAGADPGLREDQGKGRTALEWAAANGYVTTVKLLRS